MSVTRSVTTPEDARWRRRLAEGSRGEPPLPPAEALAFADFALNRVSRTFALNIRILPARLRVPVLYAYLYCRMADTLEDDALLPAAEKARLLGAFSELFAVDRNEADSEAAFRAFPALLPPSWLGTEDWEKLLLEHAPVVLRAFPGFAGPVRAAIARCVTEMCAGMAEFSLRTAARFSEARVDASKDSGEGPALIRTVEELDRYCYFVAGTVGVMLCDLFIDYARIPAERAEKMRALCVSFGLGLQLTNILKDRADDAARGVSWLPPGVSVEALFAKTRGHLEEALEYTCLIPRLQRRLRLFCLWPLFMAAETLSLLAGRGGDEEATSSGMTNPGPRLKISRARVARILLRTRLFYFSNAWLRAEFDRAAAGVPALPLPIPSSPDTFPS